MSSPSLLRLILLLLATALPVGCAYVTKPWITPEVTPLDFRPGQMTASQQTFLVRLNVKNPNDRTLPIKGASYTVEVEGHEIANGTGSLDEQIPAFDEGVVEVAVNTSLMNLLRDVPTLSFAGGKLDYKISGILKLAGGYLPVPFRYSGELETAQIVGYLTR